MQLRSGDGSVVLYFDPVTKQVWGEDSGSDSDSHMNVEEDRSREEVSGGNHSTMQDSPMEDFGDADINAAARLLSAVSIVAPRRPRSTLNNSQLQFDDFGTPANPATPTRSQFPDWQSIPRPDPITTTYPTSQTRPILQPTQANLSFTPGGPDAAYIPTFPGPNHSDPSGSHESDVESEPRFSATAKGKRRADLHVPMSGDESISGGDEMLRASVTPTPQTTVNVCSSLICVSSTSDAPPNSRTAPQL